MSGDWKRRALQLLGRSGQDKAKKLKWYFVGTSLLACLLWLLLLFMPQPDYGFEPAPEADISTPSPWAEHIAEELRSDPVYVDPMLADTAVARMASPQVRAAVDASATPVRVLVVPITSSSPGESAASLLLAEVIRAVDDDGYYVLVQARGGTNSDVRSSDGRRPYFSLPYDATPEDLAAAIAEVDEEFESAHVPNDVDNLDRILGGLAMGAMICVPIWYLGKLIRRAARRNDRHVEGFRA